MKKLEAKWLKTCRTFLPLHQTGSLWRYNRALRATDPDQGWKIHLTATILTAVDTLGAVAPFLSELDVAYKAPATLNELSKINSGLWYGYGQVGKFITIYPRRIEEFRFICGRLYSLARGTGLGPAVPFDNKYRSPGKIYYRYGNFSDLSVGTGPGGSPLLSPSRENVPAPQSTSAQRLPLPHNPFRPRSLRDRSKTQTVFSQRYHVFRALSQRGKGGVYEAIDIAALPPRTCIIKEGRRHGETGWDGRDGFSRIRNEESVLASLAVEIPNLPAIYDQFSVQGNAYLVLEKIEGVGVQKIIDKSRKPLPLELAMHISRELARFVAALHENEIVWRDCKPANLILEKSGRLRAIDLEGSCRIDDFDPFVWSTPIFEPQEILDETYPTLRATNLPEDLFALGTCLYIFFEGRLPFRNRDYAKPLPMKRRVRGKILDVILNLLDHDPDTRPRAADVLQILSTCHRDIFCSKSLNLLSPRKGSNSGSTFNPIRTACRARYASSR